MTLKNPDVRLIFDQLEAVVGLYYSEIHLTECYDEL